METLFTFAASHFCEKARWGLDLAGVDYREVCWSPGPHVPAARRLAPATSVPILQCRDGAIQGSDRILDWLDARQQTPWNRSRASADDAEVRRLEHWADAGPGNRVRRVIYAEGLCVHPQPIYRCLTIGTGRRQKTLARLLWPVTRRIMMTSLRVRPADAAEARADLDRDLDDLDARLADGRRFLVGNRLTRADLSVASLISPIAHPPQHPVYPAMEIWPTYRRMIDRYRDRRSIVWALGIYRDFRGGDRAPGTGSPVAGDLLQHAG